MKILGILGAFLHKMFSPIKANALFFIFMYLLGCVCAWTTLPDTKNAEIYENLYLELFFDLFLLCAILLAIPVKIRRWVKMALYVLLYVVALVDVYCFVNFDSTLNPSILMLVGETDGREAGEFLSTLVSPDLVFSKVGWILLLIIVNVFVDYLPKKKKIKLPNLKWNDRYAPYAGLICLVFLLWGGISSAQNKIATWKLMSGTSVGDIEHTLTENDHAVLYTPISRLIFSMYANSLASKQVDKLVASAKSVEVDSCSYRSPNIVLIIGESYGKRHSQQYGYFMPTTPRQIKREKSGLLVPFTDVVVPWNLTSFVFKNVFSMHVVGEKGEWCDYPLFPELFRKAGYNVSFLTNQFLPQAKAAVYDFSGGFFLNNPQLSKAQFDIRNDKLHVFDEDLLTDYDNFVKNGKIKPDGHNLTIFHLIGQHVNYRTRCPRSQFKFFASSYEDKRPELTPKQRKVLSYYDNAVQYNDSVVDQICKRFEDQDAIVIYMPDHGEECYEDNRGFICRNHSASIDWPLAHYEFEIPFWIYCSPKYAHSHPEIFKEIVQARKRRLMTDALPDMLLYLAGIASKDYHEEYNVLSDKYDEMRPRILKGTTDYDKLRDAYLKNKKKK
jgi:heptose-I-phosphate ethanolaminephosphotransferase